MHILQLTDFYRPVVGGLERHVETLSRELSRLGHTTTVVTLQVGDEPHEEIIDGTRVIRIRAWSSKVPAMYANAALPFHPTAPDPGAMAALHRVIQRECPDVVHSHSWLQYSYFPLHRKRRAPAHVVTLHDYGLSCPKKTLQQVVRQAAGSRSGDIRQASLTDAPTTETSQRCSGPRLAKCLTCAPAQYGPLKGCLVTAGLRASRTLHGRADRYIAISNAVANGSRSALPAHTDITVIPTMVPNNLSALAEATPRPAFLPPEDGYIMFVGALGRHKGLDVLLEARRRMHNQPPLVLIGTPRPDTPTLDEPGITVALNIPSAQVMAAWSRAALAVVPSVWDEPFGQVAVEAMLVGRAVVASNGGGLRDVVEHDVTGLTVPPGEPQALAQALDSLLDDPAMRQRMGEAGLLRARRFEAAAVAPQVVGIFEEALATRAEARCANK
jgi:glycosyltransferase involved in cell wall biosynthesis